MRMSNKGILNCSTRLPHGRIQRGDRGSKNTQIYVKILLFSLILTNYHDQNKSIYVKNQLSRIIGGT